MTSFNKDFVEKCIIAYPMNNIKNILKFNGIVRHLNHSNNGKIILFVNEPFQNLIKHIYSDICIELEIVDSLQMDTVSKLMLQKYKNYKQRNLFGFFDKYRLDKYKNTCVTYNDDKFNPYLTYGFDENLLYKDFIIPTTEKNDSIVMNNIRKFINLDYHLFCDDVNIPLNYRKNGAVGIIISKMFNNDTFFKSIVLISKSKAIHTFDNETFSLYLQMISKSESLAKHLIGKKIFFYYNKKIPIQQNIPREWNLVKI